VFRHDYIADHFETILAANQLENTQEHISRVPGAQQLPASVAAARDEMEVIAAVAPL
jgi:hypothetical protein